MVPQGKIVTGFTNMYIADVPTPVALPFAYFPSSQKQQSGFLFPTIGENNNRGYFLQNGGYYLALSDYYDLAFQSRFGREEWLKPYIEDIIMDYAKKGVKKLQIISPAFSVDCLETLEEIKIQYKELFLENGGEIFHYVPCLNDSDDQIDLIKSIIKENIKGW